MVKQQISPRTIHPYQTTVLTKNEHQFSSTAQHRLKNPWVEDINTPAYHFTGTDSSNSETAYNVPNYCGHTMRNGPPSPEYHAPYGVRTWRSYKKGEKVISHTEPSEKLTFEQCTSAFSLPLYDTEQSVRTQVTSRSPVPSAFTPDVRIIGGCGGHCPGFEYVCYYILQVIFVVGILTGISLCIAGLVLRRTNRNGDLGVLVYIGCLSSCVCGVLLGVQCCVRRDMRHRKERANAHIPLQPLHETPPQAHPLLMGTLHSQVYRPTTVYTEVSGVPWWRRNNED